MKCKTICLIVSLMGLIGLNAATYTDGNLVWTYSLSSSKATVSAVATVDGTPLVGTLSVPANVNSYPVTAVAANSFQSLSITSLTIADSVTTIGAGAFAKCTALKTVDMGNGVVTIADGEATRINYGANTSDPDSYYASGAFGGCLALESVKFSTSLTKIGHHAFSECDALQKVELPDSLQTIGVNCFFRAKNLASASFGTELESIGSYSFYACPELTTVTFAAHDTPILTVGRYVFAYDVKLTTLAFSNSLKQLYEGVCFGCTSLPELTLPHSLTYIGCSAFAKCTALKTVDMGNGVVTIADGEANRSNYGANTSDPDSYYASGAFGGCLALESVKFSSSLTKIGHHAFSECDALQKVELPDSLQTIGVNCFFRDKNLASVSFGTELESIGSYSFYACPELTTVTFAAHDTPILTVGSYVFAYDVKLTTLVFSNSLKRLNEGVCFGCTSLLELTLPDSLTYIGCSAFAKCTALKTVDMGNGVVTIANGEANRSNYGANTSDPDSYYASGAFGGCLALEYVKFSSSLTKIGHHAFSECDALQKVELPDSLQTIGVNCFFRAKNLASASFGTELESIGSYSFYACPKLTTVTFAAHDTPILTVGSYVFAYDVKLTTLAFSNSLKQLYEGVCFGCTSLPELTLPDSLTYIGCSAFAKCTALKTVDMGNGVVTIADGEANRSNYGANTSDPDSYYASGAFGGCINLESVSFSTSLTKIGHHAFSECYGLKVASLPESLLTIGVNCFYHNKTLTTVTFGTRIEDIMKYAFYNCPALRYVSFAASSTPVLTIYSGAFANNLSLSTVDLSGSLKSVQSGAFASCPLLRKLTIPSIVTEIGSNVFSGMGNLKEVTFAGLPPTNLANAGLATSVKIRYCEEWADDWEPVIAQCGFTNTVAFASGGSVVPAPSSTDSVSLTVTNVIVHYVTNSRTSDSVVPDSSLGFVNIVTEIDSSKAVAIPSEWAAQFADFETQFGSDFSSALTKTTGKKDSNGNAMLVWQDFVAGTDPTKKDEVFTASITFDNDTGLPIISWSPELSATEAAKRTYKKFGKVRLADKVWTEITDATAGNYNFFKVSVGMK